MACLLTTIGYIGQSDDTVLLTMVGTVGRMSPMLFTSCTILPNLTPTGGTNGGTKGFCKSCSDSKDICMIGCCGPMTKCLWNSTIDKISVMILLGIVFAIRDCESCLMGMLLLVFSTVPITFYFTMHLSDFSIVQTAKP